MNASRLTAFIFSAILFGLLANQADAKTYYVSTSGSDSNKGTKEKPFRTPGRASSQLKAGDTLQIGSGTYTHGNSWKGSNYPFIYLRSQGTKAKPINIIGNGSVTLTGYYGILNHRSHVKIKNINFNVKFYGVYLYYESSATIDNCRITADYYPIYSYYKTQTTLRNCTVSGGQYSVYSYYYSHINAYNTEFLSAKYYGILNYYYSKLNLDRCRISKAGYYGLYSYRYAEANIKNSIIDHCGYYGAFIYENKNSKISNCTIDNNNYYGLLCYYGSTKLYNNIISNHRYYGVYSYKHNLSFGNNLTFNNKSSNYYVHPRTATSSTDVNADPQFANSRYELKRSSPAINRGAELKDVTHDYLGNERPLGGKWDIGAYEYKNPITTFYVSTNGKDTNNGHTPSSAWKTISHASRQAFPGAKIYVLPGTYNEDIVVRTSGTKANPIKFISRSPRKAIVKSATQTWTWNQYNCKYVDIEGFKFEANTKYKYRFGLYLGSNTENNVTGCEFSGFNYGLYTWRNTPLTVTKCKFTNHIWYPTLSYYDDLRIDQCTYDNNYMGPYSISGKNFAMSRTRITKSKSWAFGLQGKASIDSCTIDGNAYGPYLANCKEKDFKMRNTVIKNTKYYSLYATNCTLDFTPSTASKYQFENNGYGVYLTLGTYTARKFDFKANNYYACMTYWSDVTFTDCTFKSKYYGCYSYQNRKFKATRCKFNDNTYWGLLAYGGRGYPSWYENYKKNKYYADYIKTHKHANLSLDNCEISNNGYGLYLSEFTDDHTRLRDTPIENNKWYGLYGWKCILEFNKTTTPKWRLNNNGYGLAFTGSKIKLKDFDLSNNKYYGGMFWYSDVKAQNCKFNNNGSYGLYAYSNVNAEFVDCEIKGNKSWGAWVGGYQAYDYWTGKRVDAKLSMKNCKIDDNNYGMYAYMVGEHNMSLKNNSISGNKYWGLYTAYSKLKFDSNSRDKLRIENNGYGIGSYMSEMEFDKYEMKGNKSYSLLAYYPISLKIENSNFSDCGGNGIYVYRPVDCQIKDTKITGNKSWGLMLYGGDQTARQYDHKKNKWNSFKYSSKASVDNVLIDGNNYGVYLGQWPTDNFKFTKAEIKNNTYYGLYANETDLTLNNTTQGDFTLSNNGYGIGMWRAKLRMNKYKISDSKYWNLLTYASDVEVLNSSISGGGNGIYSIWNKRFVMDNTVIENQKGWGLLSYLGEIPKGYIGKEGVQAIASIKNSTIKNNNYATYFYKSNDTGLVMANNSITDNKYYGLYFNYGTHTIEQDDLDKFGLARNGYGISGAYSDLTLRGLNIPESTYYGLMSWYGNLDARDCTIGTKSNGIYNYRNKSCRLERVKVKGVTGSGWGVLNYDTPLTMRNCVVAGNAHGMLIYNYTDKTAKDVEIHNSTFADSKYYGIIQYRGKSDIKNTIFEANNSSSYALYIASNAKMDHSHNMFHGFKNLYYGTSAGAGELVDEPLFQDKTNHDYHLVSGSPAINVGTDKVNVKNDMDGNLRPAFKVYEIGAYEFADGNASLRVLEWNETK